MKKPQAARRHLKGKENDIGRAAGRLFLRRWAGGRRNLDM